MLANADYNYTVDPTTRVHASETNYVYPFAGVRNLDPCSNIVSLCVFHAV